MLLRVPLAVAPAGQQRAGVADGIVAVAVVHQYVHLLGLVAQHSHWPDPLAQLVLGVEVAEALGDGDVRLLPILGVVAVCNFGTLFDDAIWALPSDHP